LEGAAVRARLARSALVFVGLVPFLGITALPANAFYVFSTAFVATATVAGGLDYPCVSTISNPITFTLPCPPNLPSVVVLPLQGDVFPTQMHADWQHNRRAVAYSSSVCQHAGLGAPNKSLSPASVTGCSFSGGGTLSGWCGLSGLQVTYTYWNGHATVLVDIHVNMAGGVAHIEGHWWKFAEGQHGLVLGVALVVPPTPVLAPAESCVNKTAETFTFVGVASAFSDPSL
jgi:hypothetical protein